MATTYYNLPTITPSTVANGPDAINGLANATDAALHQVAASIPEGGDIQAISELANTANVNAQAALNSATAANSTAAQAAQTAGAAAATANAAQSAAATNAGNIDILQTRVGNVENMLNFVSFLTATPTRTGIFNSNTQAYVGTTGASGATVTRSAGEVKVATTQSHEYFKCYGWYNSRVTGTLASGEVPVWGVPLANVGLDTPSEVIHITQCGLGLSFESGSLGHGSVGLWLHTDGYLYIECASDHVGTTHAQYLFASIYQAKQFGD